MWLNLCHIKSQYTATVDWNVKKIHIQRVFCQIVSQADADPSRREDRNDTPTKPQLNTHTHSLSPFKSGGLRGEIILSAQGWKPDSALGVTAAISRMDVWLLDAAHCWRAAALSSWIMTTEAQKCPPELWNGSLWLKFTHTEMYVL